jgi:apolipoprotein D and lipocalin family protein
LFLLLTSQGVDAMKPEFLLLACLPIAMVWGCAKPQYPPLEVVPHVDVGRYAGTWYEIARFPNRFEKGCVAVTAEYTLRKDGKVTVVNSARDKTLDGPVRSIKGKAWVADRKTNARLKVQFFWPFSGDYWIIDLDKDYGWAVVSEPSRSVLWILSRTPQLDENVYGQIVSRLKERGFDPGRLERTLQR